jgi:hypothetical protein
VVPEAIGITTLYADFAVAPVERLPKFSDIDQRLIQNEQQTFAQVDSNRGIPACIFLPVALIAENILRPTVESCELFCMLCDQLTNGEI